MSQQDTTTVEASITGLPAVADYLAASRRHDADAVARTLAPDAVVIDDGKTYSGHAEVRAWVTRTGSEYSYTSRTISADVADPNRPVVVMHLSGDFPGGEVDLVYAFTISDGLIARLTIEARG